MLMVLSPMKRRSRTNTIRMVIGFVKNLKGRARLTIV